jgi:adenosine deaminase
MRPATLTELAERAGLSFPDVTTSRSFEPFIALYRAACEVITRPDEMFRLFREIAGDAAAAGAVWVEPHVDTSLHTPRLGSHEDVFELFLAAAAAAEQATGVGVGLLVSADRTLDPAIATRQARLATTKAGAGVVSFGLANQEDGRPPEWFAEAFAIARDAGLISAPHAGEHDGPPSVLGALDVLQAERIGHGVRAVEDPDLVRRLADEQTCCDICPTSNITLGLYRSIREHPIGAFIDAGVPVTINSDDPLMFRSGLLEEYRLVADGFGLDDDAMAAIARTSIERSGMPADRRARALAAVDTWLA